MIRLARWEVMLALLATLATGWLWGNMTVGAAATNDAPEVYRLHRGIEPSPYYLVFRHCSWAEDSAANIKLVEFTPERVTYRCERSGY
jgi:hypothetical protein